MNKNIEAISSGSMEALIQYSWPGNIRELQNVIERSVVIHKDGDLSVNPGWLPRACFPTEPAARCRFEGRRARSEK